MGVARRVDVRPFDLLRTFALQRFGLFDPTATSSQRTLSKAFASARGITVVDLTLAAGSVTIEASGADEESTAVDLAASLQTDDGYASFAPSHPLLAKLHRTLPGLRLVRVPWRFDVACCAVLQQRVTVREALQQWRRITQKYGDMAASRPTLRTFPNAECIARLESWRLEELGVDPKRTRAMIALAREVHRRDLFGVHDLARVRKIMHSVRGIGPWTTELTLGFGYGDPDALPVGDLHLPHLVTWALAREPLGTDARMEELLEPCRGQRFRAVRLLLAAGITVPRVGRSTPHQSG
jgi:3-methyladenine DNA glycosylase/8-oxoguanine DNA glycosylase